MAASNKVLFQVDKELFSPFFFLAFHGHYEQHELTNVSMIGASDVAS